MKSGKIEIVVKPTLTEEFTKEVLKVRLENSDRLLFISSENSRASDWVSFELQYYQEQVKNDILMIVLDGEDGRNFRKIAKDDLFSCFKDEVARSDESGCQEYDKTEF